MKRSTQSAAPAATLTYASRMLFSAALLGGLALGILATLAQVFLLKDAGAVFNLVFLIPLAMLSWIVVPRVWSEPTPAAVHTVRTAPPTVRIDGRGFADRRELAYTRHS